MDFKEPRPLMVFYLDAVATFYKWLGPTANIIASNISTFAFDEYFT